jgi:hypothetical protein
MSYVKGSEKIEAIKNKILNNIGHDAFMYVCNLESSLKEAETVIRIYSNPDDSYWVEKSEIVEGVRIFYIKDIQQLSFMAKQYFKKGKT